MLAHCPEQGIDLSGKGFMVQHKWVPTPLCCFYTSAQRSGQRQLPIWYPFPFALPRLLRGGPALGGEAEATFFGLNGQQFWLPRLWPPDQSRSLD